MNGAKKRIISANPQTEEGRIALAKMVTKLFDHWKLSTENQLVLLGLPERCRGSLELYRKGTPLADSPDLLGRVATLLSIHRSLRVLFPQNREIVYLWPTTANRAFGDLSLVDIARKDGFPGLLAVKRYLDSEIGR